VDEVVSPARTFKAHLSVPGDKSIAHRALIFSAIAGGRSQLTGIPDGADVAATIACLRDLGVQLDRNASRMTVHGRGLDGFTQPEHTLQCANSGTTMRLLAGLLAGGHVSATLVGDDSLQRRPMDRVILPLRKMGARIVAHDGCAPLRVDGTRLKGADHELPRPSAQVKSALILAGLQADGATTIREPVATRDHTERLLQAMGARLKRGNLSITVESQTEPLKTLDLSIPGDFSSAAFLLGAAAIRPGWRAQVVDVGLNPSRTAFLDLLKQMGARVDFTVKAGDQLEPRGDITVTGEELRAVELGPEEAARAIDEIPILLAVASQAHGRSSVTGAGELRVKESDRISAMARALQQMGADVIEGSDSISVQGPARLRGATVDSAGDHRIAMALAVAALVAQEPVKITNAGSVSVSYPGFFGALRAAST
jgi:3-phosphoshikimate 1-carboxyvinyltransferase